MNVAHVTTPMNLKPILILCAAVIIFIASSVYFGLPQVKRAAEIGAVGRARAQMAQWKIAAEAYHAAYGKLPEGEPIAVLEALMDEPVVKQSWTNSATPQIRDPWGSYWRIQQRLSVEVWSAGPNGQFGDADDLSLITRHQ